MILMFWRNVLLPSAGLKRVDEYVVTLYRQVFRQTVGEEEDLGCSLGQGEC